MSKLYTENGWVNWEYLWKETRAFCMVVGGRGVGKTYGLIKHLVENNIKFLYLRRLKTQLDSCCTDEANPFGRYNLDSGRDIRAKRGKSFVTFREEEKTIAVGAALSTFSGLRGVDFSSVDAILFDEAVPMIGERPINNEFQTFLSFYETVNRNRELEGRQAVKCFLLGNANKLANPYYTGWHFIKTALNMLKGSQMVWRSQDNNRIMVQLLNSPISKQKAGTALYIGGDSYYNDMALSNVYRVDPSNVKSYKLSEIEYFSTCGEIALYKVKATGRYYISSATRSERYYEGYGVYLKRWREFNPSLSFAYMRGYVDFESYEVELIFREYLDL